MSERTLVLVKPDGVQRRLVGEVISRIESKGLSLAALRLRTVDRELAAQPGSCDSLGQLTRWLRCIVRA